MTPEMEAAIGQAWRKMARREGHTKGVPSSKSENNAAAQKMRQELIQRVVGALRKGEAPLGHIAKALRTSRQAASLGVRAACVAGKVKSRKHRGLTLYSVVEEGEVFKSVRAK